MIRKIVAVWVSLAMLLGFVVIVDVVMDITPTVRATTLYVNETGSGGAYTSIQDAINASNNGDTVFVYNGTYYENVVVNKTINLTGEDRNNTIIDGGGIGIVIRIVIGNVNLTGFTIMNSGGDSEDAGIHMTTVQNCSITKNNVSWNNKYGILINSSINNNISNNYVYLNNGDGIYLNFSGNNNITDNSVSFNNYYGINIRYSNENDIKNNNVSFNNLYGIYLNFSSTNNLFNNSILEGGIYIAGNLLEYYNTQNIETSNTVNGKPVYYWKNQIGGTLPTGAGQIILANCTGVIIENQEITNSSIGIELGFSSNIIINSNNISYNWIGIYLVFSNGNNITANIASNNTHGIGLLWESNDNIIKGNNISSNTGDGIFLKYSYNNTITNNIIHTNGQYSINLNHSRNNSIANNSISNNKFGIIIFESINYTLTGENADDEFGQSVSNAGDVNNDGIDDIIVGARSNNAGGSDAGRAYVYSGQFGRILYVFTGENAGDKFGQSVSDAGDVNNDGFADIIIGAHGFSAWDGRAYVYSGQNGSLLYTLSGEATQDYFGESVSGTGDVNNDGFDDLIVGAPDNDAGGGQAGRAYVYSGRNGSLLYKYTGEADEDHLGKSVSGAGDVNNDGFDDFIVSAMLNDAGGNNAGRAYVYSGKTGGLLHLFTGEAADNYFGRSVSGAGDVNRDGFDDVIIGAHGANSWAGLAYVYSGQTGDLLFKFAGEASWDWFGCSVSGVNDVNKDGFDDVIIGACFKDTTENNVGYVYVFSGRTGEMLYTFIGEAFDDRFGISVSSGGDLNNDGVDDFIIGAYFNDAGGSNAGRAYVFLSHIPGSNTIAFNMISGNNDYGIFISSSSDNKIYHNNFINNTNQADDNTINWNRWDNNYPLGGNYWSDYNDVDNYKGPYQDIIGTDGIGDSPYDNISSGNNQDNYPLMEPYTYKLLENYTTLSQGWNLISIPLIQKEQHLIKVLALINGWYDAVQWYDNSDSIDPWKHYKVGKSFGNDLSELNETMSFWIHITQPGDTIFLYNGTQPASNQSITLHPGWNMVGFPSLINRTRDNALNNINYGSDVDAIWTFNAAAQTWQEIGPTDSFELGRGYWIHSKVTKVWDVPL